MQLQAIGKNQRRQVWHDMVMRCRNSGLSIVAWCEAEGIKPATYHYRQRQVMNLLSAPNVASAIDFVQLEPAAASRSTASASIMIQLGEVQVTVAPGVDAETLMTVLTSIQRVC